MLITTGLRDWWRARCADKCLKRWWRRQIYEFLSVLLSLTMTAHGGKLCEGVPEPTFLADLSHRVKVMLKPIFAMVASTKNPDEVKHVDALRLRKYTSCYITWHRTDDFSSFLHNARAPVEHLFSNHEFCDASWCWTKEIDERLHNIIKNAMEKLIYLPRLFRKWFIL